jgi:starch-binding outer membrane protein SusE/F
MNMRNKFLTLLLSSSFLITLWSCKKEENKIFFEEGTPPVLTSSITGSIPLAFNNKDQQAVKLFWTNPDYRFTTGSSSQSVSYQVEIDTTGANFTNPNRKILSISNDLSLTLTQDQLNDYLLNQLQLNTTMTHNVEMRVRSTLASAAVPLFSNVLKFTVKPYAIPPKVAPPASGKLFITGSASPGGWMGSPAAELASQKFTQVSPTLYVLNSIALTGGGSYLLVPVYGDWGAKYGGLGANNMNNVNGDDFKANGSDLAAPGTSGNYKIEVDFQRGKFTVTKL